MPPQWVKFTNITIAYTPLMIKYNGTKKKVRENLHVLGTAPKAHKLIDLSNFNARVSADYAAWEGALGFHEICGCNGNSLILLRTSAEHRLFLTNTFCLTTRKKATRMPPV
nr:unnamed protein product [Spirometra erinaceieuropaei]